MIPPIEFVVLAEIGVIESIARYGRMLTAETLAFALGMSAKTIYSKAKAGTLPAVRIGQSIRFDPIAVAAWLRSNTS